MTWDVTGPDAGTVAGVDFSAVENLTGAPDNHDTFALAAGGSVSGTVDGGTGGFDSLVFDVDGKTVHSTAVDPHSGSISVSGTPITYVGLEPISNTGTATDMVFDLGALPDLDATLSDSGPSLVLSGTTFESTTFTAPTGSLTINGGGSRDKITIAGIVNLVAAALTVTAEEIAVTGSITTTGDVTLTAAEFGIRRRGSRAARLPDPARHRRSGLRGHALCESVHDGRRWVDRRGRHLANRDLDGHAELVQRAHTHLVCRSRIHRRRERGRDRRRRCPCRLERPRQRR